jgi:hypothetical protein
LGFTALGKYRLIALTNNFAHVDADIPAAELEYLGWQEGPTPPRLRALFDDFCDSSEIGMRYPTVVLGVSRIMG